MPVNIANLVETPDDNESIMEKLNKLPTEERAAIIDQIVKERYPKDIEFGYKALQYDWQLWGRPNQLFPVMNDDWSVLVSCAGRGWGKLLNLKTPIFTDSGWKTILDIRVGNKVIDESGNWCNVTGVYDLEVPKKAYRLHFNDGSSIECGEEHFWYTWTHQNRKQYLRHYKKEFSKSADSFPKNWINFSEDKDLLEKTLELAKQGYSAIEISRKLKESFVRINSILKGNFVYGTKKTTQEIIDTFTHSSRKDSNHCIPTVAPINFSEKEQSIPPFILGYWLANGHTGTGRFTAHQNDIPYLIDKINSLGYECTYNPEADNQKFYVKNLITDIRLLGLYNKKYIPENYLYGSIEQRIQLLMGMMTGDGGVDGASEVSYTSSRKKLADEFYWLVISLGMKATRDDRIPKYTYKNEKLEGKRSYRISFVPTFQVFALPRKAEKLKFDCEQLFKRKHRMLVGFDEIKPELMRCISVDSPNGAFCVTEHMIVTSNTKFGSEYIRYVAENKLVERIALVGRTAGDVNGTMLHGVSGIMSVCPPHFMPKLRPAYKELVWPNGVKAQFFSSERPEALRGPQFDLAWVDEYCFVRNTKILTPTGERNIQDIKEGDIVCTHNGDRRVLSAAMTGKNITFTVFFSNGSELTGTFSHPISSRKYGWIKLGMLRKGDLVNTFHGTAYVTRIERNPFHWKTWNLEVDKTNTYYANGILVHNCALRYLDETMDMLKMTMRLGKNPKLLITTTPRPIKSFIDLLEHKRTYTITGSTFENKSNLAASFIEDIEDQYGNTTLGRQELYGEVISDDKEAVWSRELIEKSRLRHDDLLPPMRYIYLAIDPAVTSTKNSAETGITIAGYGTDGRYYVLKSDGYKLSPQGWAKEVVRLVKQMNIDKVIGEVNNGGDMIETILRGEMPDIPYYSVRASHGKVPRALPILALYERGLVKHWGYFDKLEQQMCNLNLHDMKGKLVDVVDSLVWCLHALSDKNNSAKQKNFQVMVGGYRQNLINYRPR